MLGLCTSSGGSVVVMVMSAPWEWGEGCVVNLCWRTSLVKHTVLVGIEASRDKSIIS